MNNGRVWSSKSLDVLDEEKVWESEDTLVPITARRTNKSQSALASTLPLPLPCLELMVMADLGCVDLPQLDSSRHSELPHTVPFDTKDGPHDMTSAFLSPKQGGASMALDKRPRMAPHLPRTRSSHSTLRLARSRLGRIRCLPRSLALSISFAACRTGRSRGSTSPPGRRMSKVGRRAEQCALQDRRQRASSVPRPTSDPSLRCTTPHHDVWGCGGWHVPVPARGLCSGHTKRGKAAGGGPSGAGRHIPFPLPSSTASNPTFRRGSVC